MVSRGRDGGGRRGRGEAVKGPVWPLCGRDVGVRVYQCDSPGCVSVLQRFKVSPQGQAEEVARRCFLYYFLQLPCELRLSPNQA